MTAVLTLTILSFQESAFNQIAQFNGGTRELSGCLNAYISVFICLLSVVMFLIGLSIYAKSDDGDLFY